jgi:hypothetical protein
MHRQGNRGHKLRRAKRLTVAGLLTVLCLLTLPSCSHLKFWQQDPTDKVEPCPIVQCLDRALKTCEGVTPPQSLTNCRDAVLLASDALGEVMVCQEAHAALIRCVNDFNAARGRK